MAVLEAAGIAFQHRDPAIGLVVFFLDGVRYDITQLAPAYAGGALTEGVAAYVGAHYDFTLNALYMTPEGVLHDDFGGGADLRAGAVVFLNDPAQAIDDDPYRILRYFRAVAAFGKGQSDAKVEQICAQKSGGLKRVVGWKRYQEVLKISQAKGGVAVLERMAANGVLAKALDFTVSDFTPLERLAAIEAELGLLPDVVPRMLLLALSASIAPRAALNLLAQPYGWSEDMFGYHGWILDSLKSLIDPQWRMIMGDEGFTRLVLVHWAMEGGDTGAYYRGLL
jgi:hypothetical protein